MSIFFTTAQLLCLQCQFLETTLGETPENRWEEKQFGRHDFRSVQGGQSGNKIKYFFSEKSTPVFVKEISKEELEHSRRV